MNAFDSFARSAEKYLGLDRPEAMDLLQHLEVTGFVLGHSRLHAHLTDAVEFLPYVAVDWPAPEPAPASSSRYEREFYDDGGGEGEEDTERGTERFADDDPYDPMIDAGDEYELTATYEEGTNA